MDWHVGFASPTESLDDIRDRQYRRMSESQPPRYVLTRRPYYLDGIEPYRNWTWLASVVDGFASAPWTDRRSKVKQLPDLVRQGEEAVSRAVQSWRVSAPSLSLPGELPQRGYHGSSTSLVDAVELLDLHLPLDAGA